MDREKQKMRQEAVRATEALLQETLPQENRETYPEEKQKVCREELRKTKLCHNFLKGTCRCSASLHSSVLLLRLNQFDSSQGIVDTQVV